MAAMFVDALSWLRKTPSFDLKLSSNNPQVFSFPIRQVLYSYKGESSSLALRVSHPFEMSGIVPFGLLEFPGV